MDSVARRSPVGQKVHQLSIADFIGHDQEGQMHDPHTGEGGNYAHCKAMLVEADAAQAAVEQTRSEPSGVVRLTCPVALGIVGILASAGAEGWRLL